MRFGWSQGHCKMPRFMWVWECYKPSVRECNLEEGAIDSAAPVLELPRFRVQKNPLPDGLSGSGFAVVHQV